MRGECWDFYLGRLRCVEDGGSVAEIERTRETEAVVGLALWDWN